MAAPGQARAGGDAAPSRPAPPQDPDAGPVICCSPRGECGICAKLREVIAQLTSQLGGTIEDLQRWPSLRWPFRAILAWPEVTPGVLAGAWKLWRRQSRTFSNQPGPWAAESRAWAPREAAPSCPFGLAASQLR